MAYTLYTGQILEALRAMHHPLADTYIGILHRLTENAGESLAKALDIDHGSLSELWDNNAAMSFGPKYRNQPLPEAISCMDSESEWESDL
jgi:hypothetical protein